MTTLPLRLHGVGRENWIIIIIIIIIIIVVVIIIVIIIIIIIIIMLSLVTDLSLPVLHLKQR